MELKEGRKKPQNKSKKNSRETNSYQIQFKNKINKKTDSKINQQTNKGKYNTIYSSSNYSAKTFNQKPNKNLYKNSKELNVESLNNFSKLENNAFTISNFVNSDINILKENKEFRNNKMDIKELSDSQNTKIKSNHFNNKDENIFDIKEKKIDVNEKLNNLDKSLSDINKRNLNGSNNVKEGLKKQKSSKIFKKMNIAKKFINANGIKNCNLKKDKYKNVNKRKNIQVQEDEKNNLVKAVK